MSIAQDQAVQQCPPPGHQSQPPDIILGYCAGAGAEVLSAAAMDAGTKPFFSSSGEDAHE